MRDGDFSAAGEVDVWQVIPTAWALAAMERGRKGTRPDIEITAAGLDIAHGGKDETILAKRYGNWIDPLARLPGALTPDGKSAAAFAMHHLPTRDVLLNIDAIGYGASATERLIDEPPEGYGLKRAVAVNVADTSDYTDKSGKFKMRNKRAEMHWRLREALDPENGHDFCLPDDRKLLADICAARYMITPSGIQVEQKPEIKKRLGRSTDSGDAVAQTMLEEKRKRKFII
jgi:hypothetical protein